MHHPSRPSLRWKLLFNTSIQTPVLCSDVQRQRLWKDVNRTCKGVAQAGCRSQNLSTFRMCSATLSPTPHALSLRPREAGKLLLNRPHTMLVLAAARGMSRHPNPSRAGRSQPYKTIHMHPKYRGHSSQKTNLKANQKRETAKHGGPIEAKRCGGRGDAAVGGVVWGAAVR